MTICYSMNICYICVALKIKLAYLYEQFFLHCFGGFDSFYEYIVSFVVDY